MNAHLKLGLISTYCLAAQFIKIGASAPLTAAGQHIQIGNDMKDDKTPDFLKGKRSVRITVRGSVNGYVGNKFNVAFGERSDPAAQARAQEWIHNEHP